MSMATADASAGGSSGEPEVCARDFVVDRLQEADSPMAPAELAEEYGCTNGHVRNLLADLRGEGAVERVGHGQYSAGTSEDDDGDEAVSPEESEESSGNDTDGTRPDIEAEERAEMSEQMRQSVEGGADPSPGTDGTGGDPVESESEEVVVEEGVSLSDDLPVGLMILLSTAALVVVWYLSERGDDEQEATDETDDQEEPDEPVVASQAWGA
jgi:hypothetical protein